ncbi:MAG: MmcQ/YjbR family DNA-binding protein [Sphingomonadaceae bacterium]
MIDLAALDADLRALALTYPQAQEDFPWGERVIKVRGKIFVFLSHWKGGFNVTVKLPHSNEMARLFDCCAPAGYGLGKAGWITCRLFPDTDFDTALLPGWIDESYRAVAPRRLVQALSPS